MVDDILLEIDELLIEIDNIHLEPSILEDEVIYSQRQRQYFNFV